MRLIFLSYPESVDVHKLRENERAKCFLNASVRNKDHSAEYDGTVVDISMGGCKLTVSAPSDISNPIRVGDEIEVAIELIGSKDAISFSGELRSVAQGDRRNSMGIAFTDSGGEALDTLRGYLKTITHSL